MARSSPTALDRALDELYAASPEEFVLVRARLERELRDAGEADAAADVRARRRPNLAAWACNQLARTNPEGVAALLDATQRVVDAQARAGPGALAAALRDAARERNELVDRLTDAAVGGLRGRVPQPDGYRASIAATLDAASLEAEHADELRTGRLTRALAAPAGFGPLGVPRAAVPADDERGAAERAREALAVAKRDATAAANAAKTAASELTSATLRADAATAHLEEVERALERARANVAQTAEYARTAGARAGETRAAAEAAAATFRAAEQAAPKRR
ncbi:MAG TPA: hypothetical protein VI462_18195 [Acidimicrobiia bacterium]